jgi:hypothetical protein
MKELQDLLLQIKHLDGEILQLEQVRSVVWDRARQVYERDYPTRSFLVDYSALQRAESQLWDSLGS